jgi:simple sugar transport system ATP-binding protein
VRGLTKRHSFAAVSFTLHAGEILGLTGVIGSGRTELAQALFGISPADAGEIRVEGRPVTIRSVQDAVRAGIAYVPEDRLAQGLVMRHAVGDNVIAAVLRRLRGPSGLLSPRAREAVARRWIEALGIKAVHPSVPVQTLSVGNQQRVVIAKWLAAEPRILILDSPTVGVDVVAKGALHDLVRELAGRGLGVLLISDEFPEIVSNSSRVLIMRAGRLREELPAEGLEPDALQARVEARR